MTWRAISAGPYIEDPGEFLLSDFAKLERSPLLHLGFQALDAFVSKTGALPKAGNAADAAAVAAGRCRLTPGGPRLV